MTLIRFFILALALFVPAALAGCGGGGGEEDADAGDGTDGHDGDAADGVDGRDDGGEGDAPDGTDGTDLPTTCVSNFDCSNGVFCDGEEKCVDGTCRPADELPCVDEWPCTVESCNEETDMCSYVTDDSMCANDSFCDGEERCSALHGCVGGTVPDCTDDDICTIDLCDDDRGGCVHDQRDLDGDTYVDANCGGEDCNDRDAEINPGMEEICDDGKDNNCNLAVDMSDEACRPGNDTCSDPILLTEGVEILGSTWGTAHNYTSSMCYIYSERDAVFRIDLASERDLIVNITSVSAGYVSVAIQPICGDAMSELICQETSSTMTLRRNRLSAGSYYLIVWTDHEGDFDISYTTADPTPRPANDTCDGAVDVSSGGTFTGTMADCMNDYAPTCMYYAGYDTFYTFTLTEPRKITLDLVATSGYPTLALALMTTCGDAGSELNCIEASYWEGSAHIERNFLDAGTYWIAADITEEVTYTLSVTFAAPIYPPANDRCDGAIDVSAGGYFVGNLMESYRDYTTSCSLSTYTDVAYRFTTTALQDVTLDLSPIGAAADMALAVVTDCSTMTSEVRCRSGNPAGFTMRSLPAGTYYVIVSGTLHGSGTVRGRYLLDVAFGPPTPVPPNDSCLGAQDISAGGTVIGSTLGTFDDYDTDCGPSNYYDAVYVFTLASPADVILNVDPDVSTEVALELERTCGSPASLLDCTSSTLGEMYAHSVPAGTYYLVVDTGVETDFNMSVTFGPPTSICDTAEVINIDLSGGTFTWTDSGSTVGMGDDFSSISCYSYAEDVVYRMVVPSRAVVTVEDITPTSFDTVLHIRSLCDSESSELYCNDDGGSCSLCSLISATYEAGTYFVIQDGYSTSSGSYTLSVTATAAP
jgi:hypothetical protein